MESKSQSRIHFKVSWMNSALKRLLGQTQFWLAKGILHFHFIECPGIKCHHYMSDSQMWKQKTNFKTWIINRKRKCCRVCQSDSHRIAVRVLSGCSTGIGELFPRKGQGLRETIACKRKHKRIYKYIHALICTQLCIVYMQFYRGRRMCVYVFTS